MEVTTKEHAKATRTPVSPCSCVSLRGSDAHSLAGGSPRRDGAGFGVHHVREGARLLLRRSSCESKVRCTLRAGCGAGAFPAPLGAYQQRDAGSHVTVFTVWEAAEPSPVLAPRRVPAHSEGGSCCPRPSLAPGGIGQRFAKTELQDGVSGP